MKVPPRITIQELRGLVDELHSIASSLREIDGIPRRYLNIANAAIYCDISVESIRRLISTNQIVAYRPVPGRVVIDREELDKFIRTTNRTPQRGRGRR